MAEAGVTGFEPQSKLARVKVSGGQVPLQTLGSPIPVLPVTARSLANQRKPEAQGTRSRNTPSNTLESTLEGAEVAFALL